MWTSLWQLGNCFELAGCVKNMLIFHLHSPTVPFSYRFHRYTNTNTGHPSPLFAASMLTQPRMTIQGMVEILLARGMAKEKAGFLSTKGQNIG
jgi:hypothetical protein